MTYHHSNETSLKLFLILKWLCVKKSLQKKIYRWYQLDLYQSKFYKLVHGVVEPLFSDEHADDERF